jgi:hypothetical protein
MRVLLPFSVNAYIRNHVMPTVYTAYEVLYRESECFEAAKKTFFDIRMGTVSIKSVLRLNRA